MEPMDNGIRNPRREEAFGRRRLESDHIQRVRVRPDFIVLAKKIDIPHCWTLHPSL